MTMGDFIPYEVKLSELKYEVIVVVKTGVDVEVIFQMVKV
jgi:hypothetical protein